MLHDPAVAATRAAVRGALAALPAGELVLAAVSGGADSVALAAAVAHEAPKLGLRAGAVTVDHGLQEGSAAVADQVAATCTRLGLEPVVVERVPVGGRGGPEAAARTGRHAGLDAVRRRCGAAAVLLGHTLDDQAETVLLGLARGSGARSLAGMAPAAGHLIRPFLSLRRAQTVAACAALGLPVWHDPHNDDPRHARVRVRRDALPMLEASLGPGVAAALARSADLLRADADALDELADRALTELRNAATDGLDVGRLAGLPPAIRRRVLRRAAVEAGCPAGDLSFVHIGELDRLVVDWHGQRPLPLPGGLVAQRACDRLTIK